MKFIKHLLIAAIIMPMFSHAQDIIVMRDGSIVQSKVTEITSSEVKYKKYSNLDGPLYTIDKSTILAINYENGEKETFSAEEQQPATPSPTPEPMTDEVSEEAKQRNKELIESINSYVPEYKGKVGKECNRVFCVLGIGDGSTLVNDDVEIYMQISPPKQKESFTRNTQYSYADPHFILTVKNRTASTLYIDLGNTFFVRGENAIAYYVPSATSTSSTTGSGVSVNAGAVAGALGIGGGIGKLAGGVNVGGVSSSTSVNVTYSQRVVAIPPMSSKTLDGQPLFYGEGWFCDGMQIVNYAKNAPRLPWFYFRTSKDEPCLEHGQMHTYSEAQSPVHFSLYLTYSPTEDCSETKRLTTSLFVKNIIGIHAGNSGGCLNNCNIPVDIPKYKDCIHFVGLNADGRLYYKNVPSTFPRP